MIIKIKDLTLWLSITNKTIDPLSIYILPDFAIIWSYITLNSTGSIITPDDGII
jgi:hypothetical protein